MYLPASLWHLNVRAAHVHAVLIRVGVYCPYAPSVPGCVGGKAAREEREGEMDVLVPIIGATCIGLLIYYIYILMRSDS